MANGRHYDAEDLNIMRHARMRILVAIATDLVVHRQYRQCAGTELFFLVR
jgi:hypothetical protein